MVYGHWGQIKVSPLLFGDKWVERWRLRAKGLGNVSWQTTHWRDEEEAEFEIELVSSEKFCRDLSSWVKIDSMMLFGTISSEVNGVASNFVSSASSKASAFWQFSSSCKKNR